MPTFSPSTATSIFLVATSPLWVRRDHFPFNTELMIFVLERSTIFNLYGLLNLHLNQKALDFASFFPHCTSATGVSSLSVPEYAAIARNGKITRVRSESGNMTLKTKSSFISL